MLRRHRYAPNPEECALVDRVREMLFVLAPDYDWQEGVLFGHHAFMCNGKFLCGVRGENLLVRLDVVEHDWALARGAEALRGGAGIMRGWMLLAPPMWSQPQALQNWLERALAFNPRARAAPKHRASRHPSTQQPAPQSAPNTQRYPCYFPDFEE